MIASPTVNIVVVGGGGLIGPRHVQHVVNHSNTELFAVIDVSDAGAKIAAAHNARFFHSIGEMIEFCDNERYPYPDGAIVCTPNHTHIKLSVELASHGINLLVEKPLSSDINESKAMKQYAEEKGVKLLVGHHRRFNPYIVYAKQNLDKVGEIIAVQGTWALRKDEQYFQKGLWRTDRATGGGPLMINLVHDIDLLQFLFGPLERVYAELVKKQRKHYPNVDEGAVLTLKFKSGVCGTFICSDNVSSPFNFEAGTGENPTVPKESEAVGFYRVFGSQGTLSIPDLNLFHQPDTAGTGSWLNEFTTEKIVDEGLLHEKPFDLQLDHFVDVIKGKEEPFCTADDGISALLCIDAVLRSIETGLPQVVQSIDSVAADFSILDKN